MNKEVGNYSLVLVCGTPFTKTLTWKISDAAVNLTGWSARAQVRASFTSAEKLLDLTTANSKIVLGGAAGTITFPGLDEATTEALWTQHGSGLQQAGVIAGRPAYKLGVWDLELVNASNVPTRKLQGLCLLVPGATKP